MCGWWWWWWYYMKYTDTHERWIWFNQQKHNETWAQDKSWVKYVNVPIVGSGGMKGGSGREEGGDGGRRLRWLMFLHEIEPERQNKGGFLFILKLEQLGSFPWGAPWIDYWTADTERETKHPSPSSPQPPALPPPPPSAAAIIRLTPPK